MDSSFTWFGPWFVSLLSFFLIKFITSKTLTESSSALGSTGLEPERIDPLRMEAAVVGYINILIMGIIDIFIDAFFVGATESAVTCPVQETI